MLARSTSQVGDTTDWLQKSEFFEKNLVTHELLRWREVTHCNLHMRAFIMPISPKIIPL